MRLWASALVVCLCALAAPTLASDQAIYATMAACRAANAPLATTMSKLDCLGWRQATRRSDCSKIAAHVSAGIHHTARGFDRSDYDSLRSRLIRMAGRSSQKLGSTTTTVQSTIVFYAHGGSLSHQMVLYDDMAKSPDGTVLTHARRCYIASQRHPAITAFAALAEPVPHLGFRRMKGQWVDPRTRRYWVTATHREYPTSGLPFRPTATDFIRIEAQTARSN